MVPLNKGISFPLSYYRPLAREIYNLLERYTALKHALPCYKSTHSPLEKCDICTPFERFRSVNKVFPIESLANNKWLTPYSNNFYLFMSSFLWSSVLLFGNIFNKLWKWNTLLLKFITRVAWNRDQGRIGGIEQNIYGSRLICGSRLEARGSRLAARGSRLAAHLRVAARGSRLEAHGSRLIGGSRLVAHGSWIAARGSRLAARGSRLTCSICGSRLAAHGSRAAFACSRLHALRVVSCAACIRWRRALCAWFHECVVPSVLVQ